MAEVKLFKLSYSGAQLEERLAAIGANLTAINANSAADAEFKNYVTSYYATKEELAKLFDNKTTDEIDSLVEVINILNEKYDAGQISYLLNDYLTESKAAAQYQPIGNYQPAGEYVKTNDLNDYATISYVDTKISDLLNGVDTDHDTLKEIVDLLNNKQDAAEFINALKSKADKSDLDEYALKSELPEVPSVDGLISEEAADAKYQLKGDYLVASDLEGYAKTEDIPEVPSVDGLISEEDADAKYQIKGDYLVASDLEGYAKTEDIPEVPSVDGLISEEDADAKYQIKGDYLVKADLADYAKTEDIPEVPSVDGLISEEDADDKYQAKGEYLIASDLEGYAKTEDIPEVPTIPTVVSAFENDANYLVESNLADYAKTADIPSLDGYATENYVNNQIKDIVDNAPEALNTLNEIASYFAQYPSTNVVTSALALKANASDLADYVKTKDIPTKVSYFVNDVNYLVESDLADYAKTVDIPSVEGLISKAEADNKYQSKGDYLVEADLADYVKTENLPEIPVIPTNVSAFENDANYLVESDLNDYVKTENLPEIPVIPTNVSAFENDANYLTEHQSLEDYALKADLDNYIERKVVESDSFNVIYDEASWNDSYENGALHRYYTKYPDEDLWSVELQRTATFNDKCYDVEIYSDATCETLVKNATLKASWETSEIQKVTDAEADASYYTVKDVEVDCIYELFLDNINSMSAGLFIKVKGISFPGFTQCWDGAVKAPGAKYPWVAVYFNEDVNSVVKFQYEGKDDVYPWGSKIFGKGNGHKEWGFASVAEEFQDNSFLIPENAANANPEWNNEADAQSKFDVSKFKLVLINQEDVNSLKDYVDSEIARVEAELPTVPTKVSAFENDAEYITEHQSLDDYATKEYVNEKISYLLDGVDEEYDTLKELAYAINNNEDGLNNINTILGYKANEEDVYDKVEADDKFVDKAKYDELNTKYTTLFNVVYQNATGDTATALNADYVANNLSNENTSVEITEGKGKLGDVTIPETTKTMTVTAPMQDNSTITLSSPKAFNLNNTSENPVAVTIDAPAGTTIPSMNVSGNYTTLEVNNGSITGKNDVTVSNVIINNDIEKNASVTGVVYNDNATITTNNLPKLGLANNNTSENIVPSATINAENTTVTLNKSQWNELTSNVSDKTLIVTQHANINKLIVGKGNVIVYDNDIKNRIGEVVNNTEFTVELNSNTATTAAEVASLLTGNPGIVTLGDNFTRSRIAGGILWSGNYTLDLAGHTLDLTNTNYAIMGRNTVNITITDSVGGGKLINNSGYGLWAGDNSVFTIDVKENTEIIGVTHTLYCEGSKKPHINVKNGIFKMTVGADDVNPYDDNGNYRYMLNHYDTTYTREGNCFTITGGTFYGFDPSHMYGDPYTDPVTGEHYYSMIDTNLYESQVVGTFVDSSGKTMNIYKVVKKQ